jgi:LCP family protein required for cell wall assembly
MTSRTREPGDREPWDREPDGHESWDRGPQNRDFWGEDEPKGRRSRRDREPRGTRGPAAARESRPGRDPRGRRPGSRPGGRSSRRKGWRGLSTGAKVGYISAIAVTVIIVGACLVGYSLYLKLDTNISVTKVNGLSGRSDYGVQNIIILGSQTRDGQGAGFGVDPNTSLSDNMLLIHLDASHTHATIVSIPRDTMVYEPACQSRFSGGGIVPANPQAIIDGAMNQGGPSCAVATVEHLTGISLDHFIEFDFNSFRAMVDTVGGVTVCLPQAVDDPYSGLDLSEGTHVVTGDEALAFVRTRHGVGTGTDLGRIELQQEFFASLIQKLTNENTLENPAEMYDIANTATQALTVDQGLGSVSKLLSLAETMRGLRTKNVNFITMPTIADPANQDRLLPLEPEDDIIWNMLQTGQQWQGGLPVMPANGVAVNVVNGTGIDGLAAKTAASLTALGFHATADGDASYTSSTTVTYPGSAQAAGAYSLMGALQSAPDDVQDGASGPITLTLGTDFQGVNQPAAPAPSPSATASGKAAAPAPSPSVQATPDAGQAPDGTVLQIPGQGTGIESRNGSENICTGVPGANPDTGAPPG